MKSSKVIYFLLTGAIMAALALFVVFYETETVDEKEVVVPLVNKVVDAKPIEVKKTREEIAETIKLEVVRVKPDGSLVIAGKGIPNSKIEIISNTEVIAVSDTDPIIPFSPPPKTISKLFSAIIWPTVLADFIFSLFLPDLEPPNTHIFFLKTTSYK